MFTRRSGSRAGGAGRRALNYSMERTRFFRRPVVWIILVIIGAIAIGSFFTRGDEYSDVTASVARERLESGGITSAVLEDREQVLKLDLAEPMTVDGQERSEEHTSELQSRENLVCRLLLEKK